MAGKTLLRFIMIASWMILLSAGTACAADGKPAPVTTQDHVFSELGFYTGVGYANVVEGPYVPIFFIVHMGMDMKRWFPSLQGHRGTLSLFFEPQFGFTVISKENGAEFGVGVGLKYAYPIGDLYSVYILGSVGPHVMSLKTEDQANGFIFNDTVGLGMNYMISSGTAIDVQCRLRHLSNGGIKEPNYGIENLIGLIGFSLFF
ncbi:MAG TPA: acyloxyacyl hydrolase [Syntrophales bacterium]|nr:acyloxyacyl hydrolase [Syntrophales bacterium]